VQLYIGYAHFGEAKQKFNTNFDYGRNNGKQLFSGIPSIGGTADSNGSFVRYSSHFEFISKSCYGMLRGQYKLICQRVSQYSFDSQPPPHSFIAPNVSHASSWKNHGVTQ